MNLNFITLEKPGNISSETSVRKNGYYLVYNFVSTKHTKTFHLGREITTEEALNLIKYEGIECRLFDVEAKKSGDVFVDKQEEFYMGVAILLVFASMAYILSDKNGE